MSSMRAVGREVERYSYVDREGRPRFEVVRFETPAGGKTFLQCRRDHAGHEVWDLKGVERVPYRLPRVLTAETVYLAEGEKDVHTLEAWGVVASCNPGGSGSSRLYAGWRDYFRDRHVVILPDNDEPGRKHAAAVAAALLSVAASIRIVELPGLLAKGDVTDWKDAGGTFERFRELIEAAAPMDAEARAEAHRSTTREATGGPQWPEPLASEAYHEVLGDWLRLIEPHTEADPAALLAQALVAIGNLIGHGPHFKAEGDRHHMVLDAAIVGQTAKGRKGTSEGRVRQFLEPVDRMWRIRSGLSTGEGLIYEIRDAKEGGKDPDPGESDKRLLVIEPELARVLSVSERVGNTLSPTIRQAWDCPAILSPMTKTNRCAATDPHISIIGHITKDELRRMLTDTATSNGFANRFLWVCARRSKCLPDGGENVDLTDLIERVSASVNFAKTVAELALDPGARAIWHKVYPTLSEGKPGLLGSVTSRAESQVMRIACLYALLDRRSLISAQHLAAALAVWSYCESSARYIFGDTLGDPVADELLRALRGHQVGMTRTEIRDHFGRNKSSAEIGRALAVLSEYGLAKSFQQETDGRTAEVWACTR